MSERTDGKVVRISDYLHRSTTIRKSGSGSASAKLPLGKTSGDGAAVRTLANKEKPHGTTKEELDLSQRVERVRASIDRINKLIEELKEESK
jgi:hypothetical protein